MSKAFSFLLLFLLLQVAPQQLNAHWKTLESKHFKVHYDAPYEYIAQKTLQDLITIHSWLNKYLDYEPKQTNVVVSDTIDTANGFARVIPYNLIHVYPYPPEAESVLGYYDDWLYILVLHEYLHIVHIDTKGKLPDILNHIFGKIMAPNQVLPKFITEGLAVYFESLATQRGRINSPLYNMIFRNSILYSDISLAELSNQSADYPYGGMVYLYGAFFMDYLFRYNPSFKDIAKFTHAYGKNVIPYGVNTALKQANGNTFERSYKGFKAYYKKKFQHLYQKIKKEGITKYQEILQESRYQLPICASFETKRNKQAASISITNDQLHILTTGPNNHETLYAYDLTPSLLKKNKKKRLTKVMDFTKSLSNFKLIDDRLYYIGYKQHQNKTEKRLFSYHLKTQKATLEIPKKRINHFAINENNYDMSLIVNEQGIENIYLYNRKNNMFNKLTHFSQLTSISKAVFINNHTLLFSINLHQKHWNLATLDINTKKLQLLTNDTYFDISPIYHNQNIYFISNREDNILNLYQYELKTGNIYKKTNFFSGIKSIEYDPKNKSFYALHYQKENGFAVIAIPNKSLIHKPINIAPKHEELLFLHKEKKAHYIKKDYSIFPEILPKNILPQISSGNLKNTIGVDISNFDPREYYYYSIFLNYDFDIEDLSFTFYFSDASHYLQYSLGYSYQPILADNLLINGIETNYKGLYHTFSLTFSLPIENFNEGFGQFYVSLSNSHYTIPKFIYSFTPMDISPKFPEPLKSLHASFGYYYSSRNFQLTTPGSTKGRSFNMRISFTDKDFWSDYNSLRFAISYKDYYPISLLYGAFAFQYNFMLSLSESGLRNQYVGGYPSTGSILNKMIDRTSISGYYLRGYLDNAFKPQVLNLINLEYRQHLFYTKMGYGTLPFYIHKFYFRVFYDLANISEDLYDLNLKHGMGLELTTEFFIGYFQPYTLSLGYAKGLSEEGIEQFYLEFTSLF